MRGSSCGREGRHRCKPRTRRNAGQGVEAVQIGVGSEIGPFQQNVAVNDGFAGFGIEDGSANGTALGE